jgi:hypothetical protein
MARTWQARVVFAVLFAVLALTACGDDDDGAVPTTGAARDTTTIATGGDGTTASTAPAHDLVGVWEADIQPAAAIEHVVLRLTSTGYGIDREGALGSGTMSVEGDRATFSGSALCQGTGLYRWELDGATLRFTPVEPDTCPNRAAVLDGATYTRTD